MIVLQCKQCGEVIEVPGQEPQIEDREDAAVVNIRIEGPYCPDCGAWDWYLMQDGDEEGTS